MPVRPARAKQDSAAAEPISLYHVSHSVALERVSATIADGSAATTIVRASWVPRWTPLTPDAPLSGSRAPHTLPGGSEAAGDRGRMLRTFAEFVPRVEAQGTQRARGAATPAEQDSADDTQHWAAAQQGVAHIGALTVTACGLRRLSSAESASWGTNGTGAHPALAAARKPKLRIAVEVCTLLADVGS